jgi:hypothetical protein
MQTIQSKFHGNFLIRQQNSGRHAWTDPAVAKLWFDSDPDGKVLDAKFDLRVNGIFSVTFANSDGAEFYLSGAIQRNYSESAFGLHMGMG